MQVSQIVANLGLYNKDINKPASVADVQQTTQVFQQDSVSLNAFNTQANGSITTPILGGISGIKTGIKIFDHGKPNLTTHDTLAKAMAASTGLNIALEAGIYGGLSVIKQARGIASGTQTYSGAAANVTADILGGASAGLGASIGSGITALAMRALGSAGTIGLVAAFAGGALGAVAGSELYESAGIREKLLESFS